MSLRFASDGLGSDEGLEDEPSLVEPYSSLPSVDEPSSLPSVAQPSPPVSPSVASQQPATGREEQDEHTSASPVVSAFCQRPPAQTPTMELPARNARCQ